MLKASIKRKIRDSKKFQFKQVSQQTQETILNSDICTLRNLLLSKQISSVDIVTVYCQRCYTIGRRLNLITEEFYEQALALAKEKDIEREKFISEGRENELGRFHGIPISIKETIAEKGKLCTVGCTYLSNNISNKDASIVTLIKSEGAIPIVRGNIPQNIMILHSENAMYGTALNPHDQTRTCGGSSGGDAGLVGSKCVPLGIGTDIGGSIRLPSEFSGIVGFKATAMRVPQDGIMLGVAGGDCPQTFIMTSSGPIAYSVDDLKLFMESVFSNRMYEIDQTVVPLKFNHKLYKETFNRKLRIGYFNEMPCLGTSKSVKRAVKMAVEAFKNKGHTIVPIVISEKESWDYYDMFVKNACIAIADRMFRSLEDHNEPLLASTKPLKFVYNMNPQLRKILKLLIGQILGKRFAHALDIIRPYSTYEVDKIRLELRELEASFKKKWEENGLDLLICPSTYHCAFKNDLAKELGTATHYQYMWNVLQQPAGAVPITEVLREEEGYYEDKYNDYLTKVIKKSMINSAGMPIGVQVVGQRWKDEVVLAGMKILDSEINYRKNLQF